MHHRKMPAGRASLHRRQHHAIDRLMPFTGAPLFHALQLLATSDSARFHMPGHKGQPVFNSFRDVFAIDYTETYGTGNLYLGDGPIRDAEVAAARYFGANDCFFLTGGSTQGILAMLGAAVGRGGSARCTARSATAAPCSTSRRISSPRPCSNRSALRVRCASRTPSVNCSPIPTSAPSCSPRPPTTACGATFRPSPTCAAHTESFCSSTRLTAHTSRRSVCRRRSRRARIWPCSPCTRPCPVSGRRLCCSPDLAQTAHPCARTPPCSAPPAPPTPSWPRSILHAHIMKDPAAKNIRRLPPSAAKCANTSVRTRFSPRSPSEISPRSTPAV